MAPFPKREWRRLGRAQSGFGLLLGVIAVVAGGCSSESGVGERGFGPPEVTVEVSTVEPEPFTDVAPLSGQLVAEYSVMIKPEIDGVVAAVEFEEGQVVARGDVLFRLRSEEQRARLREAEAELALAKSVFDRTKMLANRDVSSAAQQDRAIAERDIARARVELARLEVERTEIRAPFDGVVSTRLASPGDRVEPDRALVQIDAVDRLQAVFALSERFVPLARTGVPVHVKVAAYPTEVFPGEIFYVSPSLDPVARRLVLKAWVPNEKHLLRPGMFADIEVEVSRQSDAILIAEAAVVYDREGTFVWRVGQERRAERVSVRLGLRTDGRVEVKRGLQAGDEIVVAGTHKLKEGSKIRFADGDGTREARESTQPVPPVGGGT